MSYYQYVTATSKPHVAPTAGQRLQAPAVQAGELPAQSWFSSTPSAGSAELYTYLSATPGQPPSPQAGTNKAAAVPTEQKSKKPAAEKKAAPAVKKEAAPAAEKKAVKKEAAPATEKTAAAVTPEAETKEQAKEIQAPTAAVPLTPRTLARLSWTQGVAAVAAVAVSGFFLYRRLKR